MKYRAMRNVLLVLALLLCVGCAEQTTPAQLAPTLASQAIQAAPSPLPTAVALQPAVPATSVAQPTAASQASAEPSIYLWPTYLPDGMRVSPPESHVANAVEMGSSGLGFYVMVLNGQNQKLSISGGNIKDTIPITGDEQNITAGNRSGKLITNGVNREIIFDVSQGKLFLYSAGLSKEELLKVADSLQPSSVQTLRGMLGS